MEIRKLNIQNFMSIGTAELMLNDRGLVLIQGVNKDDTSAASNGAGKSSIADGISWCLFGKTARGETGDAIVNQKAGGDTRVQITLADDDGKQYVVTRNRKHSHSKNRLTLGSVDADGTKVDLTLGTDRQTQELIESIVGCSESVFTSAIYAGQERMPDLPSMTDKQLKELLEEAAGISELHGFYQRAKAWHSSVKDQLSVKQANLKAVDRVIADASEWIVSFEESHFKWLEKKEADKKHLRATIKETFGDDPEARLTAEITAAKREVLVAAAAYEVAKAALAKKDPAEQGYLENCQKAERKVVSLEATLKASAAEILRAKADLERIEGKVGSPCGECGKVYEADDLDSARKAQTAGLRGRVQTHRDLQEALSEARRISGEAKLERDTYIASKPPMEALQEAALDAQYKVQAARDLCRDLEAQLERYRLWASKLDALEKAESPDWDKLQKAIERKKSAVAELEAATKEVAELEKSVALHAQAVEVFGPAGVRAHILDNVTPYLNTRTGEYLSTLSDGNLTAVWSTLSTTAKGELRERFVIEVSNATGGNSFGLLSGGEKRKVRLACALALQDLVSTRATKAFRLFVADEIDDALDPAGLERLMAVLEEKARERGTVLVISHNSLSDWIRDVVTVEKSEGQSVVRGVLCPS